MNLHVERRRSLITAHPSRTLDHRLNTKQNKHNLRQQTTTFLGYFVTAEGNTTEHSTNGAISEYANIYE